MYLGQLKELYESVGDEEVLEYGIEDVFSWRGSYDEVAFSVGKDVPAWKGKMCILRALSESFYCYKGGEYYTFNHYTIVNFEKSINSYSEGTYRDELIEEISDEAQCDLDTKLVNLMINTRV